MRFRRRTLFGLLFLVASFAAISLIHINPNSSTPTRSTQTRTAGILKGLVKGYVITQEIRTLKEYLAGVDLIFTQGGRYNTSLNHLVILDANNRELLHQTFSSRDLKEGDFTPFRFERPLYTGKGNLIRYCFYSEDGTEGDHVSMLFNQTDSIGPLYISAMKEEGAAASVKERIFTYKGSLMMRTFGSSYSQNWLLKGILWFIALLGAITIIWYGGIKAWLIRTRFRPEWVMAAIAVPGSLVFAIITPPLQVPDEGSHFFKSYDIAEFNFFTQEKTTPRSIVALDSAFRDLHAKAGVKTNIDEITSHFSKRLAPEIREKTNPPPYVLPYIPQALGIFLGKLFGSSPLTLMYLGRIFNLLFSVLILFFAIRIVPMFKWIFLLLALMPKTVFLLGSLSYDSLTISLTFLAIAVFLHYAFHCERSLTWKDLAVMAGLVLLLLLCKPPYFLVGTLFLFIPPARFGRMYRYLIGGIGVVALAAIGYVGYSVLSGPPAEHDVHVNSTLQAAVDSTLPVIRPEEQIVHIKSDIPAYLGMIFRSGFIYSGEYIVESFVGLLGWIDVELPDLVTFSYLFLLLLASVVLAEPGIRLQPWKKGLLAVILVASFIVIETAMYIYATRPGRDQVFGVQGRYFIPVAPLLFMLFYNRFLNPKLNLLFSPRRKEYAGAKQKSKQALLQEILSGEQFFDKSFQVFLTLFTFLTLIYSVYVSLIRYFNI